MFLITLPWVLAMLGVAAAPTPDIPAYALVVGANEGGPGQQSLAYAENDAYRMASVLTEIAGYDPEAVDVLLSPARTELEQALAQLARRVRAHTRRDEQVMALFYYSGHARAQALSLGHEEVRLQELRGLLDAMAATVTLVVLDACQSGAISGVKGANPTPAFSVISSQELNAEGMVLMASSTASEFSQESDTLRGSYFTHHLDVGLRGAADRDHDGRVSLTEAYRYAYNNTLRSTAATRVGKQHVTLESNLRGQGDLTLTVTDAQAQLVMPSSLRGSVLVLHAPSGNPVAELEKAPGAPLALALAPGPYEVFLEPAPRDVRRCALTLRGREITEVRPDACPTANVVPGVAKAAGEPPTTAWEIPRFGVELTLDTGFTLALDAYLARLESFGYQYEERAPNSPRLGFSLTLTYALRDWLQLGVRGAYLDHQTLAQPDGSRFEWEAAGLSAVARPTYRLWGNRLQLFGQAGVGAAVGFSALTTSSGIEEDHHIGPMFEAGAGAAWRLTKNVGALTEVGYVFAPTLENTLGERHNTGGLRVSLGVQVGI